MGRTNKTKNSESGSNATTLTDAQSNPSRLE